MNDRVEGQLKVAAVREAELCCAWPFAKRFLIEGRKECCPLGWKLIARSRSDGDLHSKLALESVAENLVEGGETEIQIDGPDEIRGAVHQGGQARSGIVLRLFFL